MKGILNLILCLMVTWLFVDQTHNTCVVFKERYGGIITFTGLTSVALVDGIYYINQRGNTIAALEKGNFSMIQKGECDESE